MQRRPNEQKMQFRLGLWFLRRARRVAIAAGLLAIASMSNSGKVAAATDGGSRECTIATLKGRYLFAAEGTFYPPAFGVTEPTPAADAGYQLINRDGTGTDTVTLRVGGVIVLQNVTLPTIYTVNADCTGTKSVVGGPNFGIFVAPDGSEFASIATDSGNFVSNIDHRVSNK